MLCLSGFELYSRWVPLKRDFPLPTYSLGTSLKSVKHVKDLGIMVSSDLSWSEQVNVTVNKAKKLLELTEESVV